MKKRDLIWQLLCSIVKFIHSEKATKFCEIFPLLLTTVHTVKSKGKISQNFVAFSDHMNFMNHALITKCKLRAFLYSSTTHCAKVQKHNRTKYVSNFLIWDANMFMEKDLKEHLWRILILFSLCSAILLAPHIK